jgi:hypothetical protein
MSHDLPATKKIPNCITKQHFYKIYAPMPEYVLKKIINEIIVANRITKSKFKDIPVARIKKAHYVFKEEILEFAKDFGIPTGYEL